MISLKNVQKFFYKGKSNEVHALDNITLDLPDRGMIALFGQSGSGKTTLLNVVGGLTKPDEGEVCLNGESLNESASLLRNRYIGYIFQNYNLCEQQTVFENVANALRLSGVTDEDEIREQVKYALCSVGMENFGKRLPGSLSGGQQQRVAIARAIVKNPLVVLADEPAGNLDHKNTINVMNILREISKEHLVVLVTHEKTLVDAFCDSVVLISDGKITETKDNTPKNEFRFQDKNEICLADFERTGLKAEYGNVDFYGDAKDARLQISVVRSEGTIYIRALSENAEIKFLDEKSEIRFIEERLPAAETDTDDVRPYEIKELTRINPKKIGKLFGWKDSLKNGLKNTFYHSTSSRLLRWGLILCSFIFVVLTAKYSVGIQQIWDAKKANNCNVFYGYVDELARYEQLKDAIGTEDTGIDYYGWVDAYELGDQTFTLRINEFQSDLIEDWDDTAMFLHGVLLPNDLMEPNQIVAGTDHFEESNDAVITTEMADSLLQKRVFSFLTDYDSLVGFALDGEDAFRIIGVVKSDETAVYVPGDYLFASRFEKEQISVVIEADRNNEVKNGYVKLKLNDPNLTELPLNKGDKIQLNGQSLIVSDVQNFGYPYSQWLTDNGITLQSFEEWTADKDATEFDYLDYYFVSYMDYLDYCRAHKDTVYFDDVMKLAVEGNEVAQFILKMDCAWNNDYYYAAMFKKDFGHYPSQEEREECFGRYDDPYIIMEDIQNKEWVFSTDSVVYTLSEEDYYRCGRAIGKTEGYELRTIKKPKGYMKIHSCDSEKTAEYVASLFESSMDDYGFSYMIPSLTYKGTVKELLKIYFFRFVLWGVLFLTIGGLIFFITRSGLIVKRKEYGIYLCIGVKKSNLAFRFLVENVTGILATSGVCALIMSAVIWIMQIGRFSYLLQKSIYYPVWLGLLVIFSIFLVTVICASLSIALFLKRSPSDIASDFDL